MFIRDQKFRSILSHLGDAAPLTLLFFLVRESLHGRPRDHAPDFSQCEEVFPRREVLAIRTSSRISLCMFVACTSVRDILAK
jgi:hypothetical protein